MKRALSVLVLLMTPIFPTAASHPLEGRWLGGIQSDRGQMQFGLELKDEAGTLTGAVKTPHGDWPVTSVTESKGRFTVAFNSGQHAGSLSGTLTGDVFSGEWDNRPDAAGTFELRKVPVKK